MYKKSLFAVLLFVFIAAPVTGSVRSGLEEHKRLADEAWGHVARGDNVSAGKGIENVVAVARMYRDLKNDADAREYFRRATVIAPLRVDVRFDYAQVCAKTGDAEAAKGAYRIVLAQAENDRMLAESAAFLGVEAFKELPAFATAENWVGEKGIRLCLVTVPGGQRWLAHDVGARLGRLLKVDVYVEERDFVPQQPDRGGLDAYVKELREKLPWGNFRFSAMVLGQGILFKDKATDRQILALARRYVQAAEGSEAAAIFDRNIELLTKHGGQWRAGLLMSRLRLSAMPRSGQRTLYVALIPQDLFDDNSNFLFGTSEVGGEYGVVSYCRFSAEVTGETPKRERLVTRTCKQMLSSVGHMLGVPRSNDPMCARAYPASLEEHDAKGDKLCGECRAGFAKALGHELGE